MNLRVAIYSRYSSDLQSDASIEDQIRLCTEKAGAENWSIINCYTDAGISGASLMRPGIQALLQAAMNGEFDILLAEAMDRLSRDQEDIAGLYKRMEFAGVKIITLSEGEISSLHIGLKGTMNALFLKDLADKTHRGLRGRVENGKSGGGIGYGYRVAKQFDAVGEPLKGEREINEEQAAVIRRIFHEYAVENKSPRTISAQLNQEGIPGPSGKAWGTSTIYGNRHRGTGIINNELYNGKLVWNRQKFMKDPQTRRRVTRCNPASEWIIHEVPHLRIVPEELWNAAKGRQKQLDRKKTAYWKKRRPQYLFSGLIKCGVCGSGYSKLNSTQYGCSASRNKGLAVCGNRKTIKRETLENYVLEALETRLMRDDLVKVFCEEYRQHLNTLHKAHNSALELAQRELKTIEKERGNLIQALKDGIPAALVKDDLERVTNRQSELETAVNTQPELKPLIHPAMALRYRETIGKLRNALHQNDSHHQAAERLRAVVEKIVLSPNNEKKGGLQIDLYGHLAGILNLASGDEGYLGENTLATQLPLLATESNNESKVDKSGSGGQI